MKMKKKKSGLKIERRLRVYIRAKYVEFINGLSETGPFLLLLLLVVADLVGVFCSHFLFCPHCSTLFTLHRAFGSFNEKVKGYE